MQESVAVVESLQPDDIALKLDRIERIASRAHERNDAAHAVHERRSRCGHMVAEAVDFERACLGKAEGDAANGRLLVDQMQRLLRVKIGRASCRESGGGAGGAGRRKRARTE